MGFFDSILDISEHPEKKENMHKCTMEQGAGQGREIAKTDENHKIGVQNQVNGQLPVAKTSRARQFKPEKLSFLRPCPSCSGRAFTYGATGGFFCTTCQPGHTGRPVEATGPGRGENELNPRPHVLDNQSALLYDLTDVADTQAMPDKVAAREWKDFAAALPWIKERIQDLLACGWTRASLFRRGKHRSPCGNWGVAWLAVWKKPGLVATIGRNGTIVFTYHASGRTIEQTAAPPFSDKI